MLARFYLYLKDKIEIIEAQLTSNFCNHDAGNASSIFYFRIIRLNLYLVALEILSDLIKFAIIIFADTGQGFNVIFKQRELKSCPYSYHGFTKLQKKLRLFSFSGLTSVIAATVIVSLVLNLFVTPFLPAYAVTYDWNQSDWSVQDNGAYPGHSGSAPEQNWSKYASKTASINASGTLALNKASGPNASSTNTSDTDFLSGQFNPTQLGINGAGADAQILVCTYDHAGQNWTPTDGDAFDVSPTVGVIEIHGNHCNVNDFNIPAGRTVNVVAYNASTGIGGKVGIYAQNSTIAGSLDATGKGYAPGIVVAEMDSITNPTQMGAGGSWGGGGSIRLNIFNSLTINGSIKSNGYGANQNYANGASGGSIWISAGIIAPSSGTISSTGGINGFAAAPGRGGRIAFDGYSSFGLIMNNITASATGGAGTIYQKSNSQAYGDLTVNNYNVGYATTQLFTTPRSVQYDNLVITKMASVAGVINVTAGNLTVDNNGTLSASGDISATQGLNGQSATSYMLTNGGIYSDTGIITAPNFPNNLANLTLNNFRLQLSRLTLSGDLIAGTSSVLTHPQGNTAGLTIAAANADIRTTASIDVSYKGYNASGPGFPGSHGGISGGSTYGSTTAPYQLGSGGSGNTGGGHIRMIIANNFTLNGLIKADGSGNIDFYPTPASGGSVWISAGNVLGTAGSITANGGQDGLPGNGGGGGRIAIDGYSTFILPIANVKAFGGSAGSAAGGAGTIYLRQVAQQFGDLIIANNLSGHVTPASSSPVNLMLDNLTVTKFAKLTNVINATTTNLTVTATSSITASGAVYYKDNYTNDGSGTVTATGGVVQYALAKIKYLAGKTLNRVKSLFGTFILIPGAQAATFEYISAGVDSRKDTSYYAVNYTTFNFTGQFVTFQFATSSDGVIWSGFFGPGGTAEAGDVYATSGVSVATRFNTLADGTGPRYLKYKAFFDNTKDARLSDITFNYTTTVYSPIGSLTSNWYNTKGDGNIFGKVKWREDVTLPAGTNVYLYLQTAPNNDNGTPDDTSDDTPGAPTGLVGPDNTGATNFSMSNQGNYCTVDGAPGPCCSKTGDQVTCNLPDNYPLGDGGNFGKEGYESVVSDQWMQYQIFIASGNARTPTVDDIGLTYVVNVRPEAQLITAIPVETNTGTVAIDYRASDADTFSRNLDDSFAAFWPGYVLTNLEYRISATSSWQRATLESATSTLNNDSNDPANYRWSPTSTFVWEPRLESDLNNLVTDQVQVRVRVNDLEGGNNIGYSAASAPFSLDLRKPVIGAVNINASTQVGSQPATVTLSATDDDDTGLEQRLSLCEDFAPNNCATTDWAPYATTTGIQLATDPGIVHIEVRDQFQNTSHVAISSPESPTNVIIGDLSNVGADIRQLYLSWKVSSIPAGAGQDEFQEYAIWRATSSDLYSDLETLEFVPLESIPDKFKNYYLDSNVTAGVVYFYKVTTQTNGGNISRYLQVLKDTPDGQGRTDVTPPAISNIEVTSTTTQTATIAWDTNEPANSTVIYVAEEEYNANQFANAQQIGLTSMANFYSTDPNNPGLGRHLVTLMSLVPDTKYYFKIKSTDLEENTTVTDKDHSDLALEFRTKIGPTIVAEPSSSHISNTEEEISWQTNLDADSIVVYSTSTISNDDNPELDNPIEFKGDVTLTQNHKVRLSGLTPGRRYYYYVKSTDDQGNAVIGKKAVATGIIGFYDFVTKSDLLPPTLTTAPVCELLQDSGLMVRFSTDEPATTTIIYGLGIASLASTSEPTQNFNLDQNVNLNSLAASTTYYFRITMSDESTNSATTTIYSCTTNQKLITEEEANQKTEAARQEALGQGMEQGRASASGGGIMTIDKTDKVAPVISDIRITNLTATSAQVSWLTNEAGNGFVRYGFDNGNNDFAGLADLLVHHNFSLKYLEPNTQYNYQVESADSSGNLAKSDNLTFQTPALSAEEALALSTSTVPGTKEDRETLMKSIAEKAISIITSMANQVSLGSLENTLLSQYNAIEKLAQIIPAPVLSGEPAIDTTPTTATIRWNTDKPSNSLIAFVPEAVYAGARGDAAYSQVVGDALAQVTKHEVKLYNLKPEVVYHYQLRSKAPLGPLATSRDFSFKTKPEALEITSYTVDTLSPQKTTFRWLTSSQTDTQLRITPFRGNMLAVEEAKTYIDKTPTTNHEQLIDQLESGTVYQVTLFGIDQKGIRVEKVIPTFSTTKDDLPPTIDNIQTESALSQGKDLKVQTAISWITNEPTACSLKYAKGSTQVETDLTEETIPEASYSRKHALVITKFELGSVYSFRIYCTDSGDNQTISEPHAILTPKQRDSVFDLIINTMEQTFGWIGKLKG